MTYERSGEVLSEIKKVREGIDFIVNHFKIATAVSESGSALLDAYDNFMLGVQDEFKRLEQGKVDGPEYHFRANSLLFALMMGRIYMHLFAPDKKLAELDALIARAKKL